MNFQFQKIKINIAEDDGDVTIKTQTAWPLGC